MRLPAGDDTVYYYITLVASKPDGRSDSTTAVLRVRSGVIPTGTAQCGPCAAAHFSGPVVPWRSRAAKRPALSDLGFMCKPYLACECCQVGVGANALACWRPHVLAGKSGKSRLPEQHRSPLLANLKHAALALSNNRTLLALAIRFVTVI